jgi:F0F1-type ATP synthase assembly protein I
MSNYFSEGSFDIHVDTTKWGFVEYCLVHFFSKPWFIILLFLYGLIMLYLKFKVSAMKKKLKGDLEIEKMEEEES